MLSVSKDIGAALGPASLGGDALLRLEHAIVRELRDRVAAEFSGATPPYAGMRKLLAHLLSREFGVTDSKRVLMLAAPVVRRAWLACLSARSDPAVRGEIAGFERWLMRLESLDPLSALMIDLRYFVGMSVQDTADTVGVSVHTVLHDLRSAKAWLYAYLGKSAGAKGTRRSVL